MYQKSKLFHGFTTTSNVSTLQTRRWGKTFLVIYFLREPGASTQDFLLSFYSDALTVAVPKVN